MVISIVLQSVIAVAKANDVHQMDISHVQTQHSHESHQQTSLTDASLLQLDEHNIEDCHHCGHCHGSHSQWVVSKNLPPTSIALLTARQFFYLSIFDNGYIEEHLRPPIS